MKRVTATVALLLLAGSLAGCANMSSDEQRTLSGGAAGAAGGAALGAITGGSAAAGAVLGGAAGAAGGYLWGEHVEDHEHD